MYMNMRKMKDLISLPIGMDQTIIYRPPDKSVYYIPINDTTLELSVFWLSDTESRINELRFSDSVSPSSIFYPCRITYTGTMGKTQQRAGI